MRETQDIVRVTLVGLSLTLVIAGCSSTHQFPGSHVNFDIDYGFYEELHVATWHPKDEVCAKIVITTPYLGPEWIPEAGLILRNKSVGGVIWIGLKAEPGNVHSLMLAANYRPASDARTEQRVLSSGYDYNEVISLKLKLAEDGSLMASNGQITMWRQLAFKPDWLAVYGASAQATVAFDEENCAETAEDTPSIASESDRLFDFNGNGILDEAERKALGEFQKTNQLPPEVFDIDRDGVTTDDEMNRFIKELSTVPGIKIEPVGKGK